MSAGSCTPRGWAHQRAASKAVRQSVSRSCTSCADTGRHRWRFYNCANPRSAWSRSRPPPACTAVRWDRRVVPPADRWQTTLGHATARRPIGNAVRATAVGCPDQPHRYRSAAWRPDDRPSSSPVVCERLSYPTPWPVGRSPARPAMASQTHAPTSPAMPDDSETPPVHQSFQSSSPGPHRRNVPRLGSPTRGR